MIGAIAGAAQAADDSRAFDAAWFGVLGLASVALVAMVGFWLVVQPWRRRAPLRQAVVLADSDDLDDLRRAEALLARAVTAGLRRRDLDDARFLLGLVRALLGRVEATKYDEAATSMAELEGSSGYDAAAAYLHLWLEARREHDARVVELYDRHRALVDGTRDARAVVSAAYLRKAQVHWRHREIDDALSCFDAVRDLGALVDQIPETVDDLQVVHGIRELFDGEIDAARAAFASARDRARQRGEPTAGAGLGLVACAWRAGPTAELDAEIGRIVAELEIEREGEGGGDPSAVGADVLLAHAALLHAVSLLRIWLATLPANEGLADEQHSRLEERLRTITDADPELGDAGLIGGLVDYWLAPDDAREAAIDRLERATRAAKGVTLPEVVDLVRRERFALGQDPLVRYLGVVKAYLTDSGVPAEVRRALLDQLRRFVRHPELGEVDVDAADRARRPSIDDVHSRGQLLRSRIDQIVRRRRASVDKALEDLLNGLNAATQGFAEGTRTLLDAEQALIVGTGEFLLPEEPPPKETSDDGETTP